jgi:MATE family multidrug resistance protein
MQPERRDAQQAPGNGFRPGSRREVVAMAWPLAVGMLAFTAMGVADTLLMGYVSTEAQGGVGLATIILFVLTAFFRGLLAGAQSVVAAADGARDRDRIERAGGAGVWLGLGTGAVATILLEAVRVFLLPHLADDRQVIAAADTFLRAGLVLPLLTLTSQGFLSSIQGLGDSRTRMWASVWGNVTNVGLDLVLIFGLGFIPALGAAGAAIATVAGTAVMLLIYARRYQRLVGAPRRPDGAVLRDAITLGLPAGTQQLMMSSAFLVTTVIIAQAGATHLAANQVLIHVLSVSFLPGFGIGEASGILVGRALGAGQRALAAETLRSGRTVAVVVMGACGVFFAVGGGWLASLFNPDPAVQALVAQLLRIAAIFQLFDAVAMVHICVLRAAGDTRFSLVITAGCAWGITVPAAWLLGHHLSMGAIGAWLGVTVEIIVLAALTSWRVAGLGSGRIGRLDLLLGKTAAPAPS